MDLIASCLHGLTALGAEGTLALAGGLFLAGLAGGLSHCAGMCGPFVLAQVTARLERIPLGAGAESRADAGSMRLERLRGAALVPYHLGRLTTYGALGAVAGFGAGLAREVAGLRWLAAILLVAAAFLFLAQASARFAALLPRGVVGGGLAPAGTIARITRPLLADPRGARGYGLGLALGFLPCGLLYAALAAAGAAGSALGGAVAMAAFALGTVPALFGVGFLGAFFGRRFKRLTDMVAGPLLVLNALLLAALALRVLGLGG
ncbi:MAG: sulfite exporter TauE/SafE family protein [Alphaproteobacteria bacterium]|nr:sulfite exporter TauE/SafE family protein [Alphaproteobacteria bacterium]